MRVRGAIRLEIGTDLKQGYEATIRALERNQRIISAERAVIEAAKAWAKDPVNENDTWLPLTNAVQALEEAERDE